MQEKQQILDSIKASRAGIRAVNSCIKTFPHLKEVCFWIINKEQENIKLYFSQLIKLEKDK